MSGFTVRIDIRDEEVRESLRAAMAAARNLTPAMKAIGERLLRSTEENFRREQDPDGRPWKPLAVISYALSYSRHNRSRQMQTQSGGLTQAFQRYLAGRKILTDSGELRGSIHYRATRTSVTVGSGKIYSAIHQLGGRAGRNRKVTIPARPYLGVGVADRIEIVSILENHLNQAVSPIG